MTPLLEPFHLDGTLTIRLFARDGSLKSEQRIENLIVTVGRNFIASRIVGNAPAVMSHMGVGVSAAAATPADTGLAGELVRVALTTAAASTNVVTYSALFAAGVGTGAVQEAGIFNAVAAGTMLNRATFPVVNKGADDTMAITWQVTCT